MLPSSVIGSNATCRKTTLVRAAGKEQVMLAVSRFVLRHKLAVVIFWLVVLAAGGAASAKLSGRLSAQFALPGAAGYQASQQILQIYGNGGPGYPEVAVVTLPPGLPSPTPAGRPAPGRAVPAGPPRAGGGGA